MDYPLAIGVNSELQVRFPIYSMVILDSYVTVPEGILSDHQFVVLEKIPAFCAEISQDAF